MIIWSSICPLSPRLLLYPAFVGVSLAGVFVLSTSGIIHCSRVAQSHLFKEFSRIKARFPNVYVSAIACLSSGPPLPPYL